jgi:SecD/SecF fusion protein
MQSKGAIRFFAIVLAIVCLYQLSFTLVTWLQEKKARDYANGDPAKERAYLDSISTVGVYNLLVKNYTYQEAKEREMNLGLDLKGGMNVTMEVSVIDLVKALSNYSTDTTFNSALNKAQQMQANSQEDFVTLFGRAFSEIDPNAKLAAVFNTLELQDRINFNSTNADVLKIIKTEADGAISRSFNILRTRIDKFGVAQPNIQQLGSGRILIELPGVKEPERVRKLIQGTARLEFWETFPNNEAFPILQAINDKLKSINQSDSLKTVLDSAGVKTDSMGVAVKRDSLSTDSTTIASNDSAKQPSLIEKMKSDTSAAGDSSAKSVQQFAKENPLFAVLGPAIFQNQQGQSEYRKGPVVGYALIKDTGKINRYLAMDAVKSVIPKDMKFLWTVKPPTPASSALELVAIKTSGRDARAPLEGDAISDARQDFGQFGGTPEISMKMNPEGAQTWKRMTGENIGKSIAIVLDDYVYSYPNVSGEIAGGNSSITGSFTINEAKDLANILKAGKLPAPARIVEESIVGPSLGDEAIHNSAISFLIAFIVIMFFMAIYYGRAGWVANIALFTNIFFIMGVLASLGAVLTLPGIAGIVLTIGLSVDANILIFERVREELRAGKGIRLAIADGFKHAMSSILDSNITLLILGIVLYMFGSGPVQGFATTLVIGVLTSLFSAVLISRLIFEGLLAKNKPISFANRFSENVYKGIHFNFVDNRKYYYILSSLVIIGGIVAFSIKGLNYGVDFEGGHTYTVQMDKSMSTEDIRMALAPKLGAAPVVKSVGTSNRYKITTSHLINDTSSTVENTLTQLVYDGLKPLYAAAPDYETFKSKDLVSSQKVGPTIADDIKKSAVWAILISCGLMFLYIYFRFKKWQYGLGATVALFHDVLIVLSLFAIFNGLIPISLEIDQHFIAAILTVMGYTMTESVVVFDRIREYLGVHHKKDDKDVINDALNATLSRTINTTLTVFFVLVVIFIFGGEVIRGFIFALLVGRVVGTYSSLCISTPIVVDFDRNKNKELKK